MKVLMYLIADAFSDFLGQQFPVRFTDLGLPPLNASDIPPCEIGLPSQICTRARKCVILFILFSFLFRQCLHKFWP